MALSLSSQSRVQPAWPLVSYLSHLPGFCHTTRLWHFITISRKARSRQRDIILSYSTNLSKLQINVRWSIQHVGDVPVSRSRYYHHVKQLLARAGNDESKLLLYSSQNKVLVTRSSKFASAPSIVAPVKSYVLPSSLNKHSSRVRMRWCGLPYF